MKLTKKIINEIINLKNLNDNKKSVHLIMQEVLSEEALTLITIDDLYNASLEHIENSDTFSYYADAIKYLQRYDPSLEQSLKIAFHCGYKDNTPRLNSCVLANLHYENELLEALNILISEIKCCNIIGNTND